MKKDFQIRLPKNIAMTGVKLYLRVEDTDLNHFSAEVLDTGWGTRIKMTMPEAEFFRPQELRDLADMLCDVCRKIDEGE